MKKQIAKQFDLQKKKVSFIDELIETKDCENEFFRFSDKYSIQLGKSNYPNHILSGKPDLINYTIDKTRILEVLNISKGSANYFVAPRMFGKTFTASMICTFYDYYYQNLYKELFEGTYIYQNYPNDFPVESCLNGRGKYFIFNLSFSNLTTYLFQEYEQSFLCQLYSGFMWFSNKYMGSDLIEQFRKIVESSSSSLFDQIINFFNILQSFCQDIFLLDNPADFQIIIFMDECQYTYLPFSDDIYHDKRIVLLSSFLGSLTNNYHHSSLFNKPILLMAGLLPLPKSVSNSTSNMIVCHDIQSPLFSHFMGFLSSDVEKMFDDFNVSSYGRRLLSDYFNNYQFCSMKELKKFNENFSNPMKWDEKLMTIYNPWSLMMSMENGTILTTLNGSAQLLSLVEKKLQSSEYFEIFVKLLSLRKVSLTIELDSFNSTMEDFVIKEDTSSLIKLLIITGFLCYNEKKIWIPNRKVFQYFIDFFRSHMERVHIPFSVPEISQSYQDQAFYGFFGNIQMYLMKYIQNVPFFNKSLINIVLFSWFHMNLYECRVFTHYAFNHESEGTKDGSKTFADIVIIGKHGLAIVFELKDSSRKNIKKATEEGYEQMFAKKCYEFSNNIEEVVLCSLAMKNNQVGLLYSSPIRKNEFSSDKKSDKFQKYYLSISSNTFLGCKITYIQSDFENLRIFINYHMENSAIIIVYHLDIIKSIESLTFWKQLSGQNSKAERDDVINSFPIKNPHLVLTFPILRGLNYYPKSNVVFLLQPPEQENEISTALQLSKNKLIIFYNESQTRSKERICEYFSHLIDKHEERS